MSSTNLDRAQINRNNSRHSTGPRTPEGKQRSALNALRHGLTGQIVVMPAEDLEAYQHHIQSFVNEYQAQGPTETQLVQSLADTAWRLNRVCVLETNLLTLDIVLEDFPNHESTHEMREAIAIAAALDSYTKALANLSLHGQRLSRQFEKTLVLLQSLQSTRQANQAADIPHRDGFVFPNDEKPSLSAAAAVSGTLSVSEGSVVTRTLTGAASGASSASRAAPVTAGNSAQISRGLANAGTISQTPPDDPSRPVDVN